MSIAKVKLDEGTKLEFGVAITGAESRPVTRFIIEGKNYSIAFPCKPVGDGIQVDITSLEHIFEAGEYPVRLEVMIEDKMYVPFEDVITLEPNVHVTTEPKRSKNVREAVKVQQVRVTSGTTPIKQTRKQPITEAQQIKQVKLAHLIADALDYDHVEGQTVVQIIEESLANYKVLSKDKHALVKNMVSSAQQLGIKFNTKLLPRSK